MPEAKYTGQIKKLRSWLAANPEGALGDLYAGFGGEEMAGTLRAIDYLKKRLELTVAASRYSYHRIHGNEEREAKQTTIYNSLRFHAKVCRLVKRDAVLRDAQADISYTRRYLNFLQQENFITTRKDQSGEIIIVVLDKAMRDAKTPHYNQRRETKPTEPKRPAKKGTDQ